MLEEQANMSADASMAQQPQAASPSADNDDGDGVWSKDIEDAFEEALAIYPPCGRRKIILTDEGKMYGRNELIARYIKMRTGKSRSRKQVSSHIQVLARKKQREFATKAKMAPNGAAKSGYAGLSSAEIVSQSIVRDRCGSMPSQGMANASHVGSAYSSVEHVPPSGLQLSLDHFSSYLELPTGGKHVFNVLNGGASFVDPNLEHIDIMQVYDKFPGMRKLYDQGPQQAFFLVKFWVDLHFDVVPNSGASFMGMDTVFESHEGFNIEVSSSVVSLGKQVVERSEIQEPVQDRGRFVYNMIRAPMCDYLMAFVHKLRELNSPEMMNRVLENFSASMVVRNQATRQVLFSSAFVFEVTPPGYGPRCNVYKLSDPHADAAGRRYTT